MKIIELTPDEIRRVIEFRRPLGLFWTCDKSSGDSIFIGCDNRTGDAWTEEFTTLRKCISFLSEDEDDENA